MPCYAAKKKKKYEKKKETSKESSPSQNQVKANYCRLTWNGKAEVGKVARARARKRIKCYVCTKFLSRGLPFAAGGEGTSRGLFLYTTLCVNQCMRTVSTYGTVEHWGWGQQESSEAGITRALFGSYSSIWSVSYFTSRGPQTAQALMQLAQEETTALKASGNWSQEGCVCPGRLAPSTSDQAEELGGMSDSRSKLAGVTATLFLSADPWFSC